MELGSLVDSRSLSSFQMKYWQIDLLSVCLFLTIYKQFVSPLFCRSSTPRGVSFGKPAITISRTCFVFFCLCKALDGVPELLKINSGWSSGYGALPFDKSDPLSSPIERFITMKQNEKLKIVTNRVVILC